MARLPKQPAKRSEINRHKLLSYYERYYSENAVPPTIRQATEACGFSSTSVTAYHIGVLVDRGLLVRTGHKGMRYVPSGAIR